MIKVHVAHFLYTRSREADHWWVRPARDQSLTNSLAYLQTLLAPEQFKGDLKDKPVILFWAMRSSWFLLDIRLSQGRKDREGRPIYDRSYFEITPINGFKYGHLPIIHNRLVNLTLKSVSDLPDRARDASEDYVEFDIELDNAQIEEPVEPTQETAILHQIFESKRNIQVPDEWDLKRIVDPLGYLEVTSIPRFTIGIGMPRKQVLPARGYWIASFRGGENVNRISPTDFDARLPEEDLTNFFVSSHTNAPTKQEEVVQTIAESKAQDLTADAAQEFRDSREERPSRWANLQRELDAAVEDEKKNIEIRNSCHGIIQLSAFLIGVHPRLAAAWNNLVLEVLLTDTRVEVDIANEWVQRSQTLLALSVKRMNGSQERIAQLEAASDELCSALISANSQK